MALELDLAPHRLINLGAGSLLLAAAAAAAWRSRSHRDRRFAALAVFAAGLGILFGSPNLVHASDRTQLAPTLTAVGELAYGLGAVLLLFLFPEPIRRQEWRVLAWALPAAIYAAGVNVRNYLAHPVDFGAFGAAGPGLAEMARIVQLVGNWVLLTALFAWPMRFRAAALEGREARGAYPTLAVATRLLVVAGPIVTVIGQMRRGVDVGSVYAVGIAVGVAPALWWLAAAPPGHERVARNVALAIAGAGALAAAVAAWRLDLALPVMRAAGAILLLYAAARIFAPFRDGVPLKSTDGGDPNLSREAAPGEAP
ncbi:MAG: hypothetical protein ACT4PT_14590 [Methanobacteriota archaeon]